MLRRAVLLVLTIATATAVVAAACAEGPGRVVDGELAASRRPSQSPGPGVPAAVTDTRLFSWFPADHAWPDLWLRFDASRVDRDFARISALGGNAVRVIVFPRQFGYPHPRRDMAARLAEVVQLAAAHGLRVQLTLFDWWQDYADVGGSITWVQELLAPYRGDRRVVSVEVQNEVDPADGGAVLWTAALLPEIRRVLGGIPVTVSTPWRVGVEGLRALRDDLGTSQPDFYSLHFYGAAATARTVFSDAREAVAPVPLVVGEFGFATAPERPYLAGVPGGRDGLEIEQARYYRAVFAAAASLRMTAPAPWTLNDFLPGALPSYWSVADQPDQYRFGVLRPDGSEKPAARVVRRYFTSGQVPADDALGFEGALADTRGPVPAGWRLANADLADFARDTAVRRSGTASARLGSSAAGEARVAAYYLAVPLPPGGGPVRASAYLRGRAVTGRDRVALAWFDADHAYLGQVESPSLPPGNSGWSRLTVRGRPPSGAVSAELHLKSSREQGTVWFDDVSVSSGTT